MCYVSEKLELISYSWNLDELIAISLEVFFPNFELKAFLGRELSKSEIRCLAAEPEPWKSKLNLWIRSA